MDDLLTKLREIESKLSRADAQVEWTGEALRELGSKLPDSRAWREIEEAIGGAYGEVSTLIALLEAHNEKQPA